MAGGEAKRKARLQQGDAHRFLIHAKPLRNLRERQPGVVQPGRLTHLLRCQWLPSHDHAVRPQDAEDRGLRDAVRFREGRRSLARFVSLDHCNAGIIAQSRPLPAESDGLAWGSNIGGIAQASAQRGRRDPCS